jgi:hypothetical protein
MAQVKKFQTPAGPISDETKTQVSEPAQETKKKYGR